MVGLGVYRSNTSFVSKFLWESSFLEGVQLDPLLCTNGSQKYLMHLRAIFYKNHPGHGDQGWKILSKLGPYTSIDEPLFMAMKIPASVAPVFLDEICLIFLI